MKILIATNSYPTSKNPTHQIFVKNIFEGLKKEGAQVDLIYNPYFRFFKSDLQAGIRFSSLLKVLLLFFSYIPFIFYTARKYDIIYSHAPVYPGFFMLAAQYLHKVNHVCYVHGSVNFYKKNGLLHKIARFTLNRCSYVITNSEYMKQRLFDEFNCKSEIILPGYNTSEFYYKEQDKVYDILFAGSATRQKGIDVILEAINNNRSYYRDNQLSIKIQCEGFKKNEYLKSVNQHNLPDIISFGNKVSQSRLAELFRESKLTILPSKEEALGLVGIEAIACGSFLIASNSGGIREYVIHGENGYLFEADNSNELQHYIEKALNHYPEFIKKQPTLSGTVKAYSDELAYKQTIVFFKKILTKS